MNKLTPDQELDFFYDFFHRTKDTDLTYIYRGLFTQTIIKYILSLAETNIDKTGESVKVKKRVYLIMVEGLQNITRHQDALSNVPETTAMFLIQKKENKYFVTTGNIIPNDRIEGLSGQIDKVNSLEEKELKSYYREVLTTGKISNKGGAGLGLIEMARKSGNKLNYRFRKLNEHDSYFYLQTEIFANKAENHVQLQDAYSLEAIGDLHDILNEKNILINFNGIFSQESLLGLLSIIESQMGDIKNVYNIIVELLQNIVRHGDSQLDNDEGIEAMFLIRQIGQQYLLTAGNYVENVKLDELRKRIDEMNELDNDSLKEFYNRKLLDFNPDDPQESGLGFAEMRMKTQKELVYLFHKIDEKYSFFTIQATVDIEAVK